MDEPVFRDELFRKKRKNGVWQVVDAPDTQVNVADTHAHLHLLSDPPLALARAGMHRVGFIESIVDPVEDGRVAYDQMPRWVREAGVNMHHMFTRC